MLDEAPDVYGATRGTIVTTSKPASVARGTSRARPDAAYAEASSAPDVARSRLTPVDPTYGSAPDAGVPATA